MHKQIVILSLSLAAVSTGTAIWLALRNPQTSLPKNLGASAVTKPVSAAVTPGRIHSEERPATAKVKTNELVWDRETVGIGGLIREDVQSPAHPPLISEVTPDELARRVARIEKETNHEMRRLVGLLNLTEDQQDKVYEKLAANSRHWIPGMAVAGEGGSVVIPDTTATATATDASDDVMSLLNADQAGTLMQDEMDRAAWWAEIITQLDSQTDIPSIDGSIPQNSTEGTVKDYEGSTVLE